MPKSSCSICRTTHPDKNVRMVAVPRDREKRKSWSHACGVGLYINSRVCVNHFREDDFETYPNNNKRYLKKGVVPSVSLFKRRGISVQPCESNQEYSLNSVQANSTATKYRSILPAPESAQITIKKKDERIKSLESKTHYLTQRIITMKKLITQLLEKNNINPDTGVEEMIETELINSPHSLCLPNMKVDIELSETELTPPDCQKDGSRGDNFSDFEIKQELHEPEEIINTTSTTTCFSNTNVYQKGHVTSAKKICPDITIKQEPPESTNNIVNSVSVTLADDFGNAARKPNPLLLMSPSSSSSMSKEDLQKSENKSISALQKEAENLRVLVHSLRKENEALRKKNNDLIIDIKNYKSQKLVLSDP